MSVVLEIHLVLAFLLVLCALIFSWTPNGRRVVNAVAGLQFITGLIVAGMMGANHEVLPPMVWLHLIIALAILAAYGLAMRAGKRAGAGQTALIYSIAGLVLVIANILMGLRMAGMWPPEMTTASSGTLAVYYTKLDGTTLGTWDVTTRAAAPGESSAAQLHDLATYAALQAVAGPPPDTSAVRFPAGTRVRSVAVDGSTATVDLSRDVTSAASSFQENGEFKGLVYTLTGIAPVNAVQITIEGRTVETLPGGHLELDAPLRRSDW